MIVRCLNIQGHPVTQEENWGIEEMEVGWLCVHK